MQRIIEVHIDELVLHGFSPHDRHQIGDAVRMAIFNQLSESGLHGKLTEGGFTPYINAGTITLNATQKPAMIGSNIGDAIYKGFSNES